MRKRNRKVKLTSRLGSRRNRMLMVAVFSLLAAAVWISTVGSNQAGTNYLIATSDLPSATELSDATTSTIQIDLKDESAKYIPADSKMANWFLAKPVRAGELIPVSALESTAETNCVVMRVQLGLPLNSTIHSGDLIDLWAADQTGSGSIPAQIVIGAELLDSVNATDALSQSVQSIEVCVNPAEVRSVVNAIAQKQVVIAVLSK